MQGFNYHTHTYRCGHASGSEEAYVQAAIKAGYRVIGISDHAPYRGHYSPNERMHEDTFLDYVKTVNALKVKYQDQITVLCGLEIEYYKEQIEELKWYRELLDFCILGQHSYSITEKDYFVGVDDTWVLIYAKQIEEACSQGLVDIIAHPDLFMYGRDTWSSSCDEAARIICECSKRLSIPVELNMGGLRYGLRHYANEERYVYPYRSFWEMAEKIQCPVVYGADAHTPQYLLDLTTYDKVNEITKGLSLNFQDEVILKRNEVNI